jgi:hypothetical protein
MTDKEMLTKEVKVIVRFVGHSAVASLGLLLLIAALAMGVTLVLLPGAMIAGTAGLLLITWGMYLPPVKESIPHSNSHRIP